jgi:hypothetical protein
MSKEFNNFLSQLKETNVTLDFFCDFDKIKDNVDSISIKLNQLNYLIGKEDLDRAIHQLWNENSSAGYCANYACAFLMFQMAWVGFNVNTQNKLLTILKTNADIKDYNFITSGNNYRKIADATHAYKDPMIAYDYMRKMISAYYYNISTPDKTNKKYRMGWLNRSALSFTPYGLYVPTTIDGETAGLEYSSTLDEWESTAIRLAQNNTSGYVKILDWGTKPQTIEEMTSKQHSYESSIQLYFNNSSKTYNGNYGGCGNVSQLGTFTKVTGTQENKDKNQQTKNRETVLTSLLNGSYTPNNIKKCAELTSSDKKKNLK